MPDLQMIATFISQASASECRNMHLRLLALLQREGRPVSDNDLNSLLRLRFPHLLWTEVVFGPRVRRPQNLQSQSLFGDQSKYVPWKRILSNAIPKTKESADRLRRVIHRKEGRKAATTQDPPAKRKKIDEDDVLLGCCQIPSRDADGADLVGCDSCERWFCFPCLGLTQAPLADEWYCATCAAST